MCVQLLLLQDSLGVNTFTSPVYNCTRCELRGLRVPAITCMSLDCSQLCYVLLQFCNSFAVLQPIFLLLRCIFLIWVYSSCAELCVCTVTTNQPCAATRYSAPPAPSSAVCWVSGWIITCLKTTQGFVCSL